MAVLRVLTERKEPGKGGREGREESGGVGELE